MATSGALDPDALLPTAELVCADLKAFVAAGCRFCSDPHLAVYQQALRHVLALRLLMTSGELYGESMAARAFALEDERDWLATLLERIRSAGRLVLEDAKQGGVRSVTLAALREALS